MSRISRTIKTAVFTLVLLAALPATPAILRAEEAGPPAGEGASVIKKVQVEGLHSIEKAELLYLLDLKEGGVIDKEGIRRGIKRAFLKGIFEDIAVESDDGLITVRVREREFIEDISIRGNNWRVRDKLMKGTMTLKEGEPMRYDLIEDSKSRLKAVLADKGYPGAKVDIEVKKEKKPYRVDLKVRIKQGKPLVIKTIRVHGRPADEVALYMSLAEGDVYDQIKLREDIENLTKFYIESGYPSPSVGPYTFKGGELDISVTTGKKLSINIGGNIAVRTKTLQGAMPFFEARDFSEDLVEEAVSRMLSIYHSRGYAFAQIAPVVDETDSVIELSFFIFEGERVKISKISFIGATLDPDRLKEIMALKEGGPYNPELLDPDAAALGDFYSALGYLNAQIGAPRVEVDDSDADISIEVSEGARVVISSIEIEGAESFTDAELTAVLNIKEGSPYNEVDLADARYRLLDYYGSRGFADIRIDIAREFEEKGVRVIFRVSEGGKIFVGKTVVKGNSKTKHKVIYREIAYEEGAPLDYAKLAKTRQGLYRLGIFRSVNVEATEKYDDSADVAIRVEEDDPGTVEVGVGYGEYERYRGFADISYRNFAGLNRQVGLRTELSTLESRVILNYYDPWFLDRKIPLRAYFLREQRREKNIDTGETRYRLRRYTASVGTDRKVDEKAKAEIFYEFSLVKTWDVKPDVILTKEDTGTLAISSIRPGLVYDTRDNVFDPRKGFFTGVSVKVASGYIFSDTDFVKVIVHGSAYQGVAKWLVVALSLRGGAAKGFADTDELPLVERFFLGGRTTVRGYNQDSLGPKGSLGSPTGGNAFVLGNLELRTYLTKSWSLVGFLDGGNVWVKAGDVDLSELKYTTGLGLRYNTPVGPIRLDWGYKLDREKGESASEVHFSIGHTF